MKTCCYCHKMPRRPNSAYCANPNCAIKKREQNRRNSATKRARQRAARIAQRQREIEAGRAVDDTARATLQQAREVLRERDDEAHRIAPRVTVTKWNIKKDRVYRVTI